MHVGWDHFKCQEIRIDIYVTYLTHSFNMHLACHITYMKCAYHLPVIPATCTVHAILILTCIQHAFCPYMLS